MNQIEKQVFQEAGNLDAVSYFQFLVQEGYRLSLIRPEELETLQYQIAELLADRFNRWTGGQSSSVPVETGQLIQQSAFYTVGYYLKSLPDAESALDELKSHRLEDLFQKGKERIEAVRKEAEALFHAVQKEPFATDVLAYNETLAEGLPMFFSSYDADFGAHDTPASIDYPLGNDKMNLTGIEYIYDYLRKLYLENKFCSLFDREEIHSLLRGYDRQYKELLFNIYDLILTNAVGCMLLGRNDQEFHNQGLHISDFDRQYLQNELALLPSEMLEELLDEAVSGLSAILSITDPELIRYIKTSAVNLKSRLKHALEVNGLQRLFLPAADEDGQSVITFEDKTLLDQDDFLKLADEIRECRYVADKLSLLHRKAPGITDLVDLLEGDCFFGEEYEEVFASLEDTQLAVLTKKLPLDPDDQHLHEEEIDREWKSSLCSWLSHMDPVRESAFLALAGRIDDQC